LNFSTGLSNSHVRVRGEGLFNGGVFTIIGTGLRRCRVTPSDESGIRKNHAPENMATLRHIALNLLKQEKTARVGIKSKRLKAGGMRAIY